MSALSFLKAKKSIFFHYGVMVTKNFKTIQHLGFKKYQTTFICKVFNKKININKIKNEWYFTMGDTLEIY